MGSVSLFFLTCVLGGVGALLRYLLDATLRSRGSDDWPWGTWTINLSGSFLLGVLVGPLAGFVWGPAVTAGFLGGYTTFSAASLEVVQQVDRGQWGKAALYAFSSLVLSVLLALAGMQLSTVLFG